MCKPRIGIAEDNKMLGGGRGIKRSLLKGKKLDSVAPDTLSSAGPAERFKWYFAKSFCKDFAGHCATEIEAICSWRKVAKEIFKAKFFDCVHHARKTLARTACTLS